MGALAGVLPRGTAGVGGKEQESSQFSGRDPGTGFRSAISDARAFCFWNTSSLVLNTSTSLHAPHSQNSLKVPAPVDRKRRHQGYNFSLLVEGSIQYSSAISGLVLLSCGAYTGKRLAAWGYSTSSLNCSMIFTVSAMDFSAAMTFALGLVHFVLSTADLGRTSRKDSPDPAH